jgi:glycosyltransferase involved in cell wall biosynthesis
MITLPSAPTASVILCVYNHGRLLGRAIESVLAQTTRDWELVIADDGSTDDSRAVAEAHASRLARVRSIHLEHGGLSAALNAASALATGRFLTTLDADDYYREEHLEDNLRFLQAHPETDLVMSRAQVLGDPYVVDLERPGQMIHLDRCAIGGTFFVRREVFEAVGRMPARSFGMDYHFARAVEAAGYVVRRRWSRTYVYDRTHAGSITKRAEIQMRAGRAASLRGELT